MARDLIVFGEDWGGLPSSTQHLVSHLAQNRKVVWVNSIGLRRPKLNRQDITRAWRKLTQKRTPAATEKASQAPTPSADFHIVNPKTLPVPRSKLERKVATELLVSQLKPVIREAKLEDPILWTSLPTAVDLAGKLNDSALVYYCGDDFSALAGVDHDIVAQREQELINRAQLILAASDELASRFPAKTTKLLLHGVDYPLFATPGPRAADLPSDGRPTAGFYGSIDSRLDLELLKGVMSQLPHWHFIFIGATTAEAAEALGSHPNAHLLGPLPHRALPGYSQHWNAGLLPFLDTPMTRAFNPLKLREYLAAGQPIVSTPFPALTPYLDLVSTVVDVESMVAALTTAEQGSEQNRRREAVVTDTWEARAKQLDGWLESL